VSSVTEMQLLTAPDPFTFYQQTAASL